MKNKLLLFLSVVFLGIGQIWGQTYDLVTSNAQLEEGAEYIIAGTTSNNNFWIVSTTQTNNNRTAIQNGTATSMPATLEFAAGYASFVLGVSGEKWSLYDANPTGTGTTNGGTANGAGGNVGYLYPVNGQNYLRTQTNSHEWSISINASTSVATIQTTVNDRAIKLNNNGGLFSAYRSGQRDIYLYKLGEIPTDPVLNASETEITGLGYMEGNTPASQSFSLNGLNLDPANGNITVTAPANFQVSTDDVSFNNSLNIAYTDGALAATDIYVRLNGGLTLGNYNGDITISGGSVNATVSVEGIVTEFSTICGEEDFENITTTSSSYSDRTWTGTNGGTWNATNARTDQTINGKAIATNGNGTVTSPMYANGMGTLKFNYVRAFTGTGSRSIEVYVNGVKRGDTIIVSSNSDTVQEYSATINISGDVQLELRTSGTQIKIDDIEWTCYSDGPVTQVATPTITATGIENGVDTYLGEAQVSLTTATDGATIYYTVNNGNTEEYSSPFTIYSTSTIETYAVADGLDDSEFAEKTITITEPASAAIPYEEEFDNTLGDWIAYNAEGTITTWSASTYGATVNGYNNGAADAWLISPKFISGEAILDLIFDYESTYGAGDLLIKYSTDYAGYGDPSSATWTDFSTVTHTDGSTTVVGDFNELLSINSDFHLAFVYQQSTDWVRWNIKNLFIDFSLTSVPEIDDSENLEAQVGVEYNYQITATGEPTSYFIVEEAPLPAGLELDETTGTISGTPTVAGEFMFGVTAENTIGTSEEALFIIDIAKGIQTVDLADITAYLGDADMTLPATTDQGFTLVYDIEPNGVATINGNELSFMDVGSVDFMASTEDNDANYEDYLEVFTITVNEALPEVWEDFETGQKPGYDAGEVGATAGYWFMHDALIGEHDGGDRKNGLKSVRIKEVGYIHTNFDIPNGVETVTVHHANYRNDEGGSWVLKVSNDQGQTWTAFESEEIICSSTLEPVTISVNIDGNVRIRIEKIGGNRINIDDIYITHPAISYDFTWNGSESSAWDEPLNWTTNAVPTNENNVEIVEVATNNYYPIIQVAAAANNIKVNANASLEIAASHSLTITNEINVDDNASFVVKDGANLVQINDVANIGSISAEKGFTFSTERNQYNFVISPVVGQNIKQLFGVGANYKAQWYDESTNMFAFFEGGYNEIANIGGAGIGQSIQENQLGASEQVAIYKGVPHNGEYTVEGLGNGNTGFHLAGNPYPSHLDLVKFYNHNQFNIEPRFLFWDNRGNEDIIQSGDGYQGDHYAQFNAQHGTATAAQGETVTDHDRLPTKDVAVGNAFMLRLLEDPESESYSFNNSQRTAGEGENFLGRNYSTDGIVSSEMDRYWLTLNTPGGISVMNAVVYYDGGNDAFGLDDNKIMGGSDDIYTLVDEHQLKIQGKSSFDVDDKIQLGYKAYAAGIHTISIYDKEGVFADGQKIFIRDFQTGIVHELTQSDFTFKTLAGEFNDRFEVFYKRSIKASENQATLSNVVIYQNENHIQIAAENQLLSDVEIYDLNGISVYQATDINLENWQVPNHLFGKGILVVVVKTADGEVVNKKLINK